MRRFIAAFVVGGAGLLGSLAVAQTPPVPAPTTPPPAAAAEAPPAPATPVPAPEATDGGPKVEITLGEKRECIQPGKHCDALAEEGKSDIKAENGTLTVLLTGVTAAHCFIGAHSYGIQTFQLTQPFDITCTDPSVTQVGVSLQSALKGYIRSRCNGSGCLRQACVTVTPTAGGVPLSTSFPTACVNCKCGGYKYEQEYDSGVQMLPVGQYVLTATFIFDASASGFLQGRGVADFSPDDLPDLWQQEHDPFKEVDRKDFGFAMTVNATLPGAPEPKPVPASAMRMSKKKKLAQNAAPPAQPYVAAAPPPPTTPVVGPEPTVAAPPTAVLTPAYEPVLFAR